MNERQNTIGRSWLERAERVLVQARRIRALLDGRIAARGLSEPELALLWACIASPPGGRGQSDLAEDLAVSPAKVSVLVERLARAGLLQGRVAREDRRCRLWEPTSAGTTLWQAIAEGFNDLEQRRGAA